MNQRKANAVLQAVKRKYKVELSEYSDELYAESGPKIVRGFYKDDDWAVVWEIGPDDWATKWGAEGANDPAGTFCEPIYSYALAVNDGD